MRARPRSLSDRLAKTIVFKGRATDPDLLDQLNMPDVDAFVALTEDDESNVLSLCVG